MSYELVAQPVAGRPVMPQEDLRISKQGQIHIKRETFEQFLGYMPASYDIYVDKMDRKIGIKFSNNGGCSREFSPKSISNPEGRRVSIGTPMKSLGLNTYEYNKTGVRTKISLNKGAQMLELHF